MCILSTLGHGKKASAARAWKMKHSVGGPLQYDEEFVVRICKQNNTIRELASLMLDHFLNYVNGIIRENK